MLCTWRCQTGPFPPQPTPSAFLALGGWRGAHRPAPQGRCGVPKAASPVGAEQLSQGLLLRQRGIRAPVGSWGRVPPRTCGDPRAHMGWPRPRTISTAATFQRPWQTHVVHNRPGPSLPRPVSMATSLSEARAGEAPGASSSGQPPSPQQPGQLPRHLEGLPGGSQAVPLLRWPGPRLPQPCTRQKSQALRLLPRRDWGSPSARTALHTPTGTPGGKEVEASLSHSPFAVFIFRKINKSLRGRNY